MERRLRVRFARAVCAGPVETRMLGAFQAKSGLRFAGSGHKTGPHTPSRKAKDENAGPSNGRRVLTKEKR